MLRLTHRIGPRSYFAGAIVVLATLSGAARADVSDEAVKAILRDRVDVAKISPGIVVGVIDARGTRVISHGRASEKGMPLNGDTIFEIGSVTKVFTAIVLADMVTRGEVKLSDPIEKYLPATVKAPKRNGRGITLADLASHVSGLPGVPSNATSTDMHNPFVGYSVAMMYAFLSSYELKDDIGSKYAYSNFGVGLLGHILALKAGTDYDTLVRTRIGDVLGLSSTRVTLGPELTARMATGYERPGMVAAPWDMPSLHGMGSLRSSTNDLLKFVAANMGRTTTALQAAMAMTHPMRYSTHRDGVGIGLGWHTDSRHGSAITWHNGATGGFHSFIGFDTNTRRGVVVLANSGASIDDIGRHILHEGNPVKWSTPAVTTPAHAGH